MDWGREEIPPSDQNHSRVITSTEIRTQSRRQVGVRNPLPFLMHIFVTKLLLIRSPPGLAGPARSPFHQPLLVLICRVTAPFPFFRNPLHLIRSPLRNRLPSLDQILISASSLLPILARNPLILWCRTGSLHLKLSGSQVFPSSLFCCCLIPSAGTISMPTPRPFPSITLPLSATSTLPVGVKNFELFPPA